MFNWSPCAVACMAIRPVHLETDIVFKANNLLTNGQKLILVTLANPYWKYYLFRKCLKMYTKG